MKPIFLVIPLTACLMLSVEVNAANQSSQPNSSNSSATGDNNRSGQKTSFDSLPDAVKKTMRSEAGNLNIENTRKLTRGGQTCYEATFDKAGLKGRVTVAEDGSLLQYSETQDVAFIATAPKIESGSQLKMQDLPEPVRQAVQATAGTNQVGEIIKSNASDTPQYHVAFNEQGIHTDLWLDPKGKLIASLRETALFAAPLTSSQAVTFDALPSAVQNALRDTGVSKSNVSDIDKGTWNGQTAYKAMVNKSGSTRPLLISENGKILGGERNRNGASGGPAASEKSESSNSSESSKGKR